MSTDSDLRVIGVRPIMRCENFKGTCFACQEHVTHPGTFLIIPLGRISEDTFRVLGLEVFECPHCHQPIVLMDVQITQMNLFDKPWQKEVDEEQAEFIEEVIKVVNDGIKEIDKQEDESGEA